MTGDDAELVSLIDNQLDEEVKGRLLARLAEDERLRTRYEALRNTGILIAGSLNVLLENAPLPRLRAMLPSWSAARNHTKTRVRVPSRPLQNSAS